MNAALASALAGVCLLFWVVERRDLMDFAICVAGGAEPAAVI